MIAPEPYLSACLEVLYEATIQARLIAYGGQRAGLTTAQSDCVADLMDAVHNIPHLLQRWEKCDERLLRSFLEEFDGKWRDHCTVNLLETYLHHVNR
jgi:hypothetical protein